MLRYDYLIIATGTETRPSETPGLKDKLWYKDIFDFYTIEGALALHKRFKDWEGGNLVNVHNPNYPTNAPWLLLNLFVLPRLTLPKGACETR